MSDMDGFLGKVFTDANNGANLNSMDGVKLIGQRQINIIQQEHISENKAYILQLEAEISSLKSEINRLKRNTSDAPPGMSLTQWELMKRNGTAYQNQQDPQELVNAGYWQADREYQALLSGPFQEIAKKNGDFKQTYEQQMEMMADWMVSQKAFKELAIEFGFDAHGYTPDQVIEMGKDKKIDVLEDKHNPSHRTNAGDAHEIIPLKEKLSEEYHKDKEFRKLNK